MNIRDLLHARLLERGIPGTARVLRSARTGQVSHCAQAGWHAPWVTRFVLLVSLPGRPPYRAVCRQYAPDVAEGSTVSVAVSRWNPRRVAIGTGSQPGEGRGLARRADTEVTSRPDGPALAVTLTLARQDT